MVIGMKKIVCLIGFVTIVALMLASCGGLSNNELKKISEEYKKSLEGLCEQYGLADAEIEVGSSFSTRDSDLNMYVESASVRCEKFNDLSAEKAFELAKTFYYLDNSYKTNESKVSFTTAIYGKNEDRYTYETKNSSSGNFEYLMKYNNAAVTYKDGKLIYNDF